MKPWIPTLALVLLVATAAAGQSTDCADATTELPAARRGLLQKYGIVGARQGFILDAALVSDCTKRLGMARALSHGMSGAQDEADRSLIRHHAALYNDILRRIWPAIGESPAVPEDGEVKSEKWGLLRDKILTDATLEALLRPRVLTHLDADAAYLLIERPVPGLRRLMEEKPSAPNSCPSERLFAPAILSRMGTAPAPDRIARALQGMKLTQEEQVAAERLKKRFARHEAAKWADLRDLWEY
jgi:hypothetical protein